MIINDEQKEKMIQDILNTEYEWDVEDLKNEWEKKLEEMGFTYPEINYSGFYSQGDGASFTSPFIQLDKYMKCNKLCNKYRALYNKIKAGYFEAKVVRGSFNYYHEKSVYLTWECYYNVPDKVMWQMEELEQILEEEIVDLSRDIYRDLKKLYEDLTSDEYVQQRLENEDSEV